MAPLPATAARTAVAVALASATGITDRGRSSKSSSSTASSTAETGLPKVAHAGRGSRGEQRLALLGGHREELPHEGAERAARGDDRPLGAEGPTRPDGDRRREGLEKRD